MVSVLGASLLAVSVYLPWYAVGFTAGGIDAAQRESDELAGQLAGTAVQGRLVSVHAALDSLAGRELGSVSAHDVLQNVSVVLIVIAVLALLDGLLPLVRGGRVPAGAGGALVLLGLAASALVAYRLLSPPQPAPGYLALSLREGSWLALVGSTAILAGGLWPRPLAVPGSGAAAGSGREAAPAWGALSGFTPDA
jgi:hypothetical protein